MRAWTFHATVTKNYKIFVKTNPTTLLSIRNIYWSLRITKIKNIFFKVRREDTCASFDHVWPCSCNPVTFPHLALKPSWRLAHPNVYCTLLHRQVVQVIQFRGNVGNRIFLLVDSSWHLFLRLLSSWFWSWSCLSKTWKPGHIRNVTQSHYTTHQ